MGTVPTATDPSGTPTAPTASRPTGTRNGSHGNGSNGEEGSTKAAKEGASGSPEGDTCDAKVRPRPPQTLEPANPSP